MFYFWSSGEKGDIWLSGEGIRDAFSRMHPEAPACSDVALLGERNLLNVTFVLEPGTSQDSKTAAEKSFLEFARKLGIETVQAGWVMEKSAGEAISSKTFLQSPFFWGGISWIAVAVLRMGIPGILMATVAAFAAFSVSALFTTRQGLEIRRWAKGLFERNV
ncbi:MAG: hypothetical protein STSR0007_12510 [Thermovirga sp.]